MNEKDILDFKASLVNMSIEELEDTRIELNAAIAKMVMESDTVMKIAIVEALLKEKLDDKGAN